MNRSAFNGFAMFFAAVFCGFGVVAQVDDGYRPGGFDANGCSKKLFSVSATKKVHFSRGNLQYNAAQDKWRFAPRQYTTACSANDNASADLNDWIDLFAWGTSGWDGGIAEYQPWTTSTNYNNFVVGGSTANSLVDDYAEADWGVHNKIANGGNSKGMWRTLTKAEWQYLMQSRANSSSKRGLATIGDKFTGMVLLPDDWTLPDGLTFQSGNSARQFTSNQYDFDQWQRMEAAGAVFLPSTDPSTKRGKYWSTTYSSYNSASDMEFAKITTTEMSSQQRSAHIHVRLVRDDNAGRGLAFDEDGASYKEFSVSATSTVRFSKGNLQYNAAQDIWRFAAKQYQYIGNANANISSSYNGWIDMFAWGTSGWNSGATEYQPWSTSETSSDYSPGGEYTNNLTGDYADADWGVHNRINNGGNKARQWRTLTKDEWEYLLGNNGNRSGKCGHATIKGTAKSYVGIVLLPDDWTLPNGVTFTAGHDNEFNTNVYTIAQWQAMESAGAIFLPAAGGRYGTTVVSVGTNGLYWSSTYYSEGYAWNANFDGSGVSMNNYYRDYGQSVRLVKD